MANQTPVQTIKADRLHEYRTGDAMRRPGNQNALKHGLYARSRNALRLRSRSVRRLVREAYEKCPWLAPSDMQAVSTWAETVKLKAAAFVALERSGPYRLVDGDVVPRRLLAEYQRLASLELKYAEQLGLTPSARIRLGVDAARGQSIDLAMAIAQTREAQRGGEAND